MSTVSPDPSSGNASRQRAPVAVQTGKPHYNPSILAPVAPRPDIKPTAPESPVKDTGDHGDIAACRRHDGKQWQELGYVNRAACVVRAFQNSCQITSAQHGEQALRRYNGHIEVQRGSHWSMLARSDCGGQSPG